MKEGFVEEEDGYYALVSSPAHHVFVKQPSKTFNFIERETEVKLSSVNREGKLLGHLYGRLDRLILGYFNQKTFELHFFNSNQIEKSSVPHLMNALIANQGENRLVVSKFNSFFESGNVHSFYKGKSKNEYDVIISNDLNSGSGAEWFYFKYYHGGSAQAKVFNIIANRFYPNVEECGIVVRQCKGPWFRKAMRISLFETDILLQESGQDVMKKLRVEHIPKREGIMEIALGEPYTSTMLASFLNTLNPKLVEYRVISNGVSRCVFLNSPVERVGYDYRVLVLARESPIQTYSSFLAEELLTHLNDPVVNREILGSFRFTVIPMVNAEGVVIGNSYGDCEGKPIERFWNSFESGVVNLVRTAVFQEENDIAVTFGSTYGEKQTEVVIYGYYSYFTMFNLICKERSLFQYARHTFEPSLPEGSIFQNLRRFSNDKSLLMLKVFVPQNNPESLRRPCQEERTFYPRLVVDLMTFLKHYHQSQVQQPLLSQSLSESNTKLEQKFVKDFNFNFLKTRDNARRFKAPWNIDMFESTVVQPQTISKLNYTHHTNKTSFAEDEDYTLNESELSIPSQIREDSKLQYQQDHRIAFRQKLPSTRRKREEEPSLHQPDSRRAVSTSSAVTSQQASELSLLSKSREVSYHDEKRSARKISLKPSKIYRNKSQLRKEPESRPRAVPKRPLQLLPRAVPRVRTVYEYVDQQRQVLPRASGQAPQKIIYNAVLRNLNLPTKGSMKKRRLIKESRLIEYLL